MNRDDELSEFLDLLADGLDIPDSMYAEATAKYAQLSEWLRRDHVERFSTDASIYPQGSMKLGTAVMPVDANSEYDVDLVYRRELKKSGTTQEALKEQLGEQLRAFLEDKQQGTDELPLLEPGRRCWTLNYPKQFHMDVLPAIPDEDAPSADAILIPDTDLRDWQHSNPKGYAAWFAGREARVVAERRTILAKEAKVDVESISTDRLRTPLRQAVRLLKRHRDLWCEDQPEDKPTSIIITTLAALAYSDEFTTASALQGIAASLLEGIEKRRAVYWIANPANPTENFADKWRTEPSRAERFFEWFDSLTTDLEEAAVCTGIHRLVERLSPAFGAGAAEAAAKAFADRRYSDRKAGELRMQTGSGQLGRSGQLRVPEHTNYGEDR